MSIYIVQHGVSLGKDIDPEKGLSPQGIQEVQKIAGVAQQYGVKVSEILHSGKQRARQTAELMAEHFQPANGLREIAGIKPLDDVITFAPQIDYSTNTMLVGHLPFLERLTAFLITGRQEPPVFKLQNGGILCLDLLENSDTPVIKWALMPRVG